MPLIALDRRLEHGTPETTLSLSLERRVRSRQRVVLDNGQEAGLYLERGQVLRHGDLLGSADGLVVAIVAADEQVSEVVCDDPMLLARACYHLGNRHVAVQIEIGRLRYGHDHVLDDMLRGLGLEPVVRVAPFEPEAGAYGGHSHGGHGHAH